MISRALLSRIMMATILVASAASGQAAIPLERFEPAIAGSDFFVIDDPEFRGSFTPRLGATLSYAHRPLVLADRAGENGPVGDIVAHQLVLHSLIAVSLLDRVLLGANLPATLSQGGDSPTIEGESFPSPTGRALGDLRLDARINLLPQDGNWPAAALGATGWVPTGDETGYAGASKARFGLSVTAGSEGKHGVWRVAVGRRRQTADSVIETGRSDWTLAAAVALRFGGFQIGPELWSATASDPAWEPFRESGTGLEAVLGIRQRIGDFTMGAALGPGLSEAPGTPKVRALLGLAWAPVAESAAPAQSRAEGPASPTVELPPRSALREGAAPAAPSVSATIQGDRDGDGVGDESDDCPDVFGESSASQPRRGCPSDRDADGIVDAEDRCPERPGVAGDDPDEYGCPADTDGDGILDGEDACPSERGKPSDDAKLHGCKPSIVMAGEQLVLTQQIRFETGSDRIAEASYEVLSQMVSMINEHEEIARVAVDGHTDDVGREAANIALSQRRAVAVVRWLIDHGVDERRLEARGFGPRRPLVDNIDAESRARNRRVEFHVVKRTRLGEAGWKDGSVDE